MATRTRRATIMLPITARLCQAFAEALTVRRINIGITSVLRRVRNKAIATAVPQASHAKVQAEAALIVMVFLSPQSWATSHLWSSYHHAPIQILPML